VREAAYLTCSQHMVSFPHTDKFQSKLLFWIVPHVMNLIFISCLKAERSLHVQLRVVYGSKFSDLGIGKSVIGIVANIHV